MTTVRLTGFAASALDIDVGALDEPHASVLRAAWDGRVLRLSTDPAALEALRLALCELSNVEDGIAKDSAESPDQKRWARAALRGLDRAGRVVLRACPEKGGARG